jgi:hypothetical protein
MLRLHKVAFNRRLGTVLIGTEPKQIRTCHFKYGGTYEP